MKKVKGFKMTNSDMNCLEFQYEIGKEYNLEGELVPCKNGFHFCKELTNCLEYYNNTEGDKRFFEIEAWGDVVDEYNKSVANNIKFIREISVDEVFEYIKDNKDIVNWYLISDCQKLSEDFIREFKDYVNWGLISMYQTLSENFIREFEDRVSWASISKYQTLSEPFVREFKDKVDWYYISEYQILSEEFIRENKDKIDWNLISGNQKLSESFIREFKNRVDWSWISERQKLSEDFIREFDDYILFD